MPPLRPSLAGRPLFINPLFYHPSITENVPFSRFPWSAARFGFTASLNATSKKEPSPSPSVASDSFEDGFGGDATQLDGSSEVDEETGRNYRVEEEVEKPDEGYMGSDELDELDEDVEHGEIALFTLCLRSMLIEESFNRTRRRSFGGPRGR